MSALVVRAAKTVETSHHAGLAAQQTTKERRLEKRSARASSRQSGTDALTAFLGFSFTAGKELKRRIAPKELDRFQERVREITLRSDPPPIPI